MIKSRYFLIFLIATGFACAPKATLTESKDFSEPKNPLILLDDKPVDTDEFLYMLGKSKEVTGSGPRISREEFDENLELFVNFKLKVREAIELGMDQTEEFEREYDMFKEDLTRPFLIKNSLQEGELMKAYNRMSEVVKASHILLQFPPNASKEDTISVIRMALKLKERAESGEDFNELAFEYSDDPSARDNKGSLGFFSALQMVSEFEDAAYSLEVGQISDPILTNFGYHIVKLEDRQPNPGEVKVSHILIRHQQTDPIGEERALQKVRQIYEELQKPETSWEEICQLYSEDAGTKNSGGSLPWIGLGTVIPEFERAAFSLQEIGEISPPVRSPFGFHIIRLDEKKPLASFEEMEASIKSRVLRDSRSTMIQSQVVAIQKSRFGYIENPNTVSEAENLFTNTARKEIGTAIDNSIWKDSVLFYVAKNPYALSDLNKFMRSENQVIRSTNQAYFQTWFDKFVAETLQNAEIKDLEENNQEYRLLINEYRDGILLFSLMNEMVWQKAIEDSIGQVRFYEEHSDRYQWGERIEGIILTLTNEEVKPSVRRFLTDKKYLPNLSDRLENTFLLDNPLAFTISEGKFEISGHPVLKQITPKGGFQEFNSEGKTYMMVLGDRIPPMPKRFEETRGKVIQDYQDHLDRELIAMLKQKYKVEIDEVEKEKLYGLAVEN